MRVRPASTEDIPSIARVHVDTWRSAYRGIVPAPFLDGLRYEDRAARWAANLSDPESGRTKFTLIAEDDNGALVGFAGGGRNRDPDPRFAGEIYAIYVAEAHARRGVGTLLVSAVAERLDAMGAGSVIVWACRRTLRRGASTSSLAGWRSGLETSRSEASRCPRSRTDGRAWVISSARRARLDERVRAEGRPRRTDRRPAGRARDLRRQLRGPLAARVPSGRSDGRL